MPHDFVPDPDIMYGPPVPMSAPGFRPGTFAIEKIHPLKYLNNERAADPFWGYTVFEEAPVNWTSKNDEFKIPEIPGVDSV